MFIVRFRQLSTIGQNYGSSEAFAMYPASAAENILPRIPSLFGRLFHVSDAGFVMSLDSFMSLVFLVMGIAALGPFIADTNEKIRDRNVAEHFKLVSDAAAKYGRQHQVTLLPMVSPTSGPTISMDDLRNSGALAGHLGDLNAWGQNYNIVARSDGAGGLTIVTLTTGGRVHQPARPRFGEVEVPATAALANAGFVPAGLLVSSGVLRGAFGGWETDLAAMGLAATPGHLGMLSTFSASELDSDFLYRLPIPGQPELNVMQTNLDMSGHYLSNVESVQYQPKATFPADFCDGESSDLGRTFLVDGEGLYVCRDGRAMLIQDTGNSVLLASMSLGENGMLVDKPLCPDGSGTSPQIFVAPSILSAGAEAPPIASFQAWASEYDADRWQVHLRMVSKKDEWVYPASDYGKVVVQTMCAQ